jgi:hypothetical protein
MTHLRWYLSAALIALGACTTNALDDELGSDDPAGDLGDAAWDDEGPLPADASSDAGEAVPDLFAVAPRFQVPFPCGQTWAGQTRTNHSPQNSVDFNRPTIWRRGGRGPPAP